LPSWRSVWFGSFAPSASSLIGRPTRCWKQPAIPHELADKASFMKGKGCSNCNKTGYRGRQGIYELMLMTSRIRETLLQGASTQDIRKAAVAQGMHTLYQDGIQKAVRGITTIDEVFRVSKREDE